MQSELELDNLLNQLSSSYNSVEGQQRVHLVPTFTYAPKSEEEIQREIDAKNAARKARQERLEYTIPKDCKGLADGTVCAGGKCFKEKCVMTGACSGDCCDHNDRPKLNGSPCEDGQCIAGKCTAVEPCYGDCCDSTKNPRADETKCSVGVCKKGGCVATKVGCSAGACCDEVNGEVRPKGFPCFVGQCQVASQCTGFSHECPETTPVEDGTYCDGGYCLSGVCVKTYDPESKEPMCTEGQCCDLNTFTFKTKGTPCSNTACSSGATCLGNSNQCPPPPKSSIVRAANDSPCPEGVCFNGYCKPTIECEEGECCRAGKMVANYTDCSIGRCFNGKCEYDKICIGDCCEQSTDPDAQPKALDNGTPCNGGICVAGRCRAPPACMGECCNGNENTPKPDGMQCNHGAGACSNGLCVSPSITCKEGQCCNVFKGYAFPAGFPCHSDPCKQSTPCLGTSGECTPSDVPKPDGYPCPNNGTCEAGVCVTPPPMKPECTSGPCCDLIKGKYAPKDTPCGTDPCKEQTFCTGSSEYCPISLVPIADGTVCKVTALGEWTCVDGVCEKPKPPPVLPACNVEKPCCNIFKQRVYPKDTLCAEAFNECVETAYCNGFDVECPINYKPDGSICTGGMCVHGQCIAGVDPTDTDTTHEIHVHHTRDGENELITITTTRKSDGSTFTKDHLVDTNAMLEMQRLAQEKAQKIIKEQEEQAKAEKAKIRKQQFDKDVQDTKRRLLEEEAKRLANMTNAELEAYNNKTAAPVNNDEPSDDELADQTEEHLRFVASLDHPGNPLREFMGVNNTSIYSQCTSGLCCNTRRNIFFPYGHICGQPKNPCQVAICSGQSSECYPVAVTDGFECPNGLCFEGECIKNCYGECCDGRRPKEDGTECETNGKCFNGICVRNCYGDCCEVNQNFAKPDGAPCEDGTCHDGKCVKEESATGDNESSTSEDPLKGKNIVAVINEEEQKDSELTKMWKKTIEEEHREQKERKEKEAEERKKKLDEEAKAKAKQITDASATYQAELKAANEEKAAKTKWHKYVLIGGAAFVGFLIIVAIIVAAVKHSNKKKQEEKDAQDSEYYYEKF